MRSIQTVPCAVFLMLACTGASTIPSVVMPETLEVEIQHKTLEDHTRPLLDLIAKHEGNYNSVNRGHAGDTPGGIQSLTGSSFDEFTVGEVIGMQCSYLGAVGRYQFIRTTLRFAVENSDVEYSDKFGPSTQDKLAVALIFHKRPEVGEYLQGKHNDLDLAIYEMAREWASIEYKDGRGYYDGLSGNNASISRSELSAVLQDVRHSWQANG